MSIEYIRKIRQKPDGIYLCSRSSNDQRGFVTWYSKSLTDIYDQDGQLGLDREIMMMLSQYAALSGNDPSLERYCYAKQSPKLDSIYNEYLTKQEEIFNRLDVQDKACLFSHDMTEAFQNYQIQDNQLRYDMYTKMAQLCQEFDKQERGNNEYSREK